MNEHFEHIDDLMLLLEVVEAGGFSAASVRSGRSKSMLSRRILALEHQLGVSLLVRNSRHFEVTDVGQRMCEHAVNIRAEARAAFATAAHSLEGPSGTLRVSCPTALAGAEVGPLAMALSRQHPRLNIVITTYNGRIDSPNGPADIVIRPAAGRLTDSGMVARKLADFHYILVASPELAASLAPINSPHDLAGLPAIGWTYHDHPGQWTLRDQAGHTEEIGVDIRLLADSLTLVADAARRSVGIAQLPVGACMKNVADGALCRLLEDWAPPPIGMYAVFPSRRHLTPGGRLFIDALCRRLQTTLGQPAGGINAPLQEAALQL